MINKLSLRHNCEIKCICYKKKILATVPLHGDQLFEERACNGIWSFQDGLDPYERFERTDTEYNTLFIAIVVKTCVHYKL